MLLAPGSGSGSNRAITDDDSDTALLNRAAMRVIHKATLQDLLRYNNGAVHQLLLEHNNLLEER